MRLRIHYYFEQKIRRTNCKLKSSHPHSSQNHRKRQDINSKLMTLYPKSSENQRKSRKPLENSRCCIQKHLEINDKSKEINRFIAILYSKVVPLGREMSIFAWTCDDMGAGTLRAHCGTWWAHCGHTAKMNLLVVAGSKEY